MPITPEQRESTVSLLRAGELSNEEIAAAVGLSAGSVVAIKANIAMGRYEENSEEDLEVIVEQAEKLKFDLERNLQVRGGPACPNTVWPAVSGLV